MGVELCFNAGIMEQRLNEAIVAPSQAAAPTARPRATRHPSTLKYVLIAEFCESFAYWGMLSLMVLYMREKLFAHGDIGRIFGLQPIIDALGTGPIAIGSLASAIFGIFSGLAMLTPIFGGLIADRWLGRTPTIAIGAALMALGHLLLSFDATFLVALLCLVLGVGCFKANITSQVGELYEFDDPKRQSGFALLLLCTNLSGIGAPLICGALSHNFGWHWGFGAGATVMLVGFLSYLWARRRISTMSSVVSRRQGKLTRAELRNVLLLALLLVPLAFTQISNHQLFNGYLVWAQKYYQLRAFEHVIPAPWLLSFDNIIVVAMIAAVARFWPWWDSRYKPIDDLTKIAFATLLGAGAPLILAMLSATADLTGQKVPLYWAIAFHLVNDLGFAIMVPAGWSLYTRAVPSLTGFMIGLYFIHLVLANFIVAWLGALFDRMEAAPFWLLHTALMAGGALVLFLVRGAILVRKRSPEEAAG